MSRIAQALFLICFALLLVGCSAKPLPVVPASAPESVPRTVPSSPAGFGAKESKSLNPHVTYPVWSVDPKEYALDSVKLGDPFAQASTRYGKPTEQTPVLLGPGGSIKQETIYKFPNGITVTDADGRIYRVQAGPASTGWETARGIKAGTSCETVLARFGPSHDGPDTYIYYAQGGQVSMAMTMVFTCQDGTIAGIDMSGF